MFRIGDFSRLARVSARLLRWYEEVGLLVPAHVDPSTGYRYYSAAQLVQLNRILALKELGLSLQQIGAALDPGAAEEKLRAALEERKTDAQRLRAAEELRITQIEARLRQIEALGTTTGADVVLAPGTARRLLGVRERFHSFAAVGEVMGETLKTIPRQVPAAALGHFVVLSNATEFEPEHLDLDVGFFVESDAPARVELAGGRHADVIELPACELIASCVRVGPPDQAHLLSAEIAFFVEAGGLQLAGPSREVFLQRPRMDRLDQSVIEMQFPVSRRPS